VQIAGVHDLAEAEALLACGVDFLGLPLRLPDGREDLSEAAAVELFAALAGRVQRVLITYQRDAEQIASFADRLACDWVQLHGDLDVEAVAALRRSRPGLGLIKALVIGAEDVFARLEVHAPHVDAFITDTFDPATGRRGATGQTHDWATSRAVVEASPLPVILAGGLHADNVAAAIAAVRPAAVDAHSRVEGADGRKDPERVRRFVERSREAFVRLGLAG
jgi:phosphoribosylanthranilate isomerase